jgi:hypothetical protein
LLYTFIMKRNYDTGISEKVSFFTGTEVEHTPAFGLHTLFVTGVQSVEEIQDWLDDFNSYEDTTKHIKHIYFGANMSFPNPDINDPIWRDWENMVRVFLQKGYLCTLDIDVKSVEGLAESDLCEYRNFIPMISVKLPYVRLLGYNATIKVDDRDFNATNPGVWCHSLHTLMDRSKFTDWNQYKNDKVIK